MTRPWPWEWVNVSSDHIRDQWDLFYFPLSRPHSYLNLSTRKTLLHVKGRCFLLTDIPVYCMINCPPNDLALEGDKLSWSSPTLPYLSRGNLIQMHPSWFLDSLQSSEPQGLPSKSSEGCITALLTAWITNKDSACIFQYPQKFLGILKSLRIL